MLLQTVSRKYIAACLAILMILSLFSPTAVFSAERALGGDDTQKYVTVSVEKFTLGQGYVVEPVLVPFEEGERASEIITELLGEGNYTNGGTIESWFYLTAIFDPNAGEVNIPEYILQAVGGPENIGQRSDSDWLSQLDYYSQSGWMNTVNNVFPNVGASDLFVEEGDVIRFQYSVYGWGEDLGSSYGDKELLIEPANKDALTEKVAEINSSSDKAELLKDDAVQLAYQNAYAVLSNMESSQLLVDNALEELVEVLYLFNITKELNKHLAYIEETVSNPKYGTGGGEWSILTLARAGYDVQDGYYETYYNNVISEVKKLMPKTENKPEGLLDLSRSTEHSRLILGLTAIGENIHDVAGYNISAALGNFDYVTSQGINGPMFALIALDSHQYEIPITNEEANQTTREKLFGYLLNNEVAGGGWGFSKTRADIDLTAMAIQALTPYYLGDGEVKAAVDRAILWLSSTQNAAGGYTSWGTENVQSVAQVIVALTGLGINPHTDERFVKNGQSTIDNLLSYAVPTGGFVQPKGGQVNGMATDQATYALVAYNRFLNNETSLYDMTDVVITDREPNITIQLPEDGESITVPDDGKNYTIIVDKDDQHKQVTIQLPEQTLAKTFIELPANVVLPQLSFVRGDTTVEFGEGIVMTNDSKQVLELLTSKDTNDVALRTSITSLLGKNKQLDAVQHFFTIGGNNTIQFENGFVTFTFKGMKGKEAVWIQNGQVNAIQKYASNQAGVAGGKQEYAYESGNDLIVKTSHFTDFAVYSVSNSSGGGEAPQPSKATAQLSIDKLTIQKGHVLSPTTVEFTPGETVWDVFKRELDSRGIAYEYLNSDQFNSVYVKSIAGDGEFDHGTGSGWMYNVNGTYPNYGVSQYKLKQGDKIQFRYTTNLGEDLGQDPLQWEENEEKPGTDGSEQGTDEPGSEPEQEQKALSYYYKDSRDVSSWAHDLVLEATEKGFVEGYNGSLLPKKEMTRAEFAKLIVEVFNLQEQNVTVSPFRDVEEKSWYYSYVNAAYAAGIVTGYNGEFLPNDTITREQMAVMIAKALGREPAEANNDYVDSNSIASWAQGHVADMTALKIMVGYDGRFDAKGTATREMAIVIAMRAFNYNKSQAAN